VADDTVAIVNALATGNDVMLPEGTYLISPTASQTIANQGYQRLYGNGNVTLSINLASSIDVFEFNGPVALENLTVDFNNSFARYPFQWNGNAGNIKINNVHVKNLKDTDSTTGCAIFFIFGESNTFDINSVSGTNLLKRGNGIIGDAEGSLSLIYVTTNTGGTQGTIQNVYVNEMHNINSSDVIIYEDVACIYIATAAADARNNITIENVHGINFGKRLIKVQASNVAVKRVYGLSDTGDSSGVLNFQQDFKSGCSATDVRAAGIMEYAFSSEANGVKWKNVIANTTPPSLPLMDTVAIGIFITGSNTTVDGFAGTCQRMISLGGPSAITQNTQLKNLRFNFTSATNEGIAPRQSLAGIDGLLVDGVYANHDATSNGTTVVGFGNYIDGSTTQANNITINNVVVKTVSTNVAGATVHLRNCKNINVNNIAYINTSGATHYRIVWFESCADTSTSNLEVEGTNTIGLYLQNCTGQNFASVINNPTTSFGAIFNGGSSNVFVVGTDYSDVSGSFTTPNWQVAQMVATSTAGRPTVGLYTGFSQCFDITLGKPIWWNGSVWKDAAGTTV
jgi:hypothetical protein